MSKVGGTLSKSANNINNILNKPQNYFKGVANRTVGNALTNVGSKLATNNGILGTIGNGMQTYGSSLAGTTGTTTGASAGGSTVGGAAAGPIASLITAAIIGANRNGAEEDAENLTNITKNAVNQTASETEQQLEQNKQNTDNILKESMNNLGVSNDGIVTGGAAPIDENYTNNLIQEYMNNLREQGYTDDVVNGVQYGLNNGNKDIAEWLSQYNSGAGKDNPIAIPQTDEEIAKARELAQKGNTQEGGIVENQQEKNPTWLDKLVSGVSDLQRGYEENKNNEFKPTNWTDKQFQVSDNQKVDKGKMARIGEVAGSISRFAEKPGVQALLAGGLAGALTGNPLYGLGVAQKFGEQRARTNAYRDILKQNGVDYNPGLFGSITDKDVNTSMTPQYKEALNNIAKAKLEENQNWHEMLGEIYKQRNDINKEKLNETINNNAQKLKIAQQNADSNRIRANKTGQKAKSSSKTGGKGTKTTTKPQEHKDWNTDISGYMQIRSNPQYADRINEARARFLNKYGVDPDKYIKL
jgi:hypothetical protein